jgi:hypothetical protein
MPVARKMVPQINSHSHNICFPSQVENGTGKNYDLFGDPGDRKWEVKILPFKASVEEPYLWRKELSCSWIDLLLSFLQGMNKRFSQSAQR